MKEALERLQHLQERLEELHRETASVLAESHRLMGDVERESMTVANDTVGQRRPPSRPKPAKRPRK